MMNLRNNTARWFVPDNKELSAAVSRTTHLGIGAHQDDLEIMAYDGVLNCFGKDSEWFAGVVVTDGAGSPRNDLYADYTDDEMKDVRKAEQEKAAFVGEYSAMGQLNYSSAAVKDFNNTDVVSDIAEIIKAAKPRVIYTHNLADKHETHVAVALRVISAIRGLSESDRPEKLYGCEVWRGLDWLSDSDKVLFDVGAHQNLAAALVSVFDSQICGGKRYDLATAGRRLANATYADSHGVDASQSLMYAMDLTPLITNPDMDIADYIAGYIEAFALDVRQKLGKLSGREL